MVQLEKTKSHKKRHIVALLTKLRSQTVLVFLGGCVLGIFTYPLFDTVRQPSSPAKPIPVCFSPGGHCTNQIIAAIDEAQTSILVMAYSFTSVPIAEALINAYERGIDVRILIDRSQLRAKHSQCIPIVQKGIPVLIDPAVGIAHNKTMIFDERYVLTGSFNFTQNAESKNAENVLIIDDPVLAKSYTENWEQRAAHAQKIIPPLQQKGISS